MPWICLHAFLPANPLMSVKRGNLSNSQELHQVAQSPESTEKGIILIKIALSQPAKGPITESMQLAGMGILEPVMGTLLKHR